MHTHDPDYRPRFVRQGELPSLLSVKDFAKLMQVSTRTIWRLLSSRKLPQPIRVGGSVRWRRDDVEAWLLADCPEQS
ncbi:MAG: helix-turn-helix domain-containing protein [Planctomycetaceae bacterium]|nr:helix-turn-helix domain-containing protein [Planctomycetaceae bacterium]